MIELVWNVVLGGLFFLTENVLRVGELLTNHASERSSLRFEDVGLRLEPDLIFFTDEWVDIRV